METSRCAARAREWVREIFLIHHQSSYTTPQGETFDISINTLSDQHSYTVAMSNALLSSDEYEEISHMKMEETYNHIAHLFK